MENDHDFEEQFKDDEPIAISPTKQDILHPNTPKGTTFNKKTVGVLVLAASLVCGIGLLYAFSPTKTENKNVAASGELARGNSNSAGMLPNSIANLSDSYTSREEANNDPNAYPGTYPGAPSLPNDQNRYDNYGNNSYDPGTYYVKDPEFENTDSNSNLNNGNMTKELSEGEKELINARKSGIRFSNNKERASQSATAQSGSTSPDLSMYKQLMQAAAGAGDEEANPLLVQQAKSDQDKKKEFLNSGSNGIFYSSSRVEKAKSKYEVKSGTIIPAVLITGINSDLPGNILAQVRENVYDTVNGKHILIPQGSRLIGLYDSNINYAQNRILVVWVRLIYPNGNSLDLQNIPGIDLSGYSGLKDRVNNHWSKIVGGALISSIISAGAKIAANDGNTTTETDEEAAASGVAEQASQVGQKIADKNLSVQPTLEIRPGYKLNLFIVKDFILQPYK
jgi:type IV secretory pathway VirB10-like protein